MDDPQKGRMGGTEGKGLLFVRGTGSPRVGRTQVVS